MRTYVLRTSTHASEAPSLSLSLPVLHTNTYAALFLPHDGERRCGSKHAHQAATGQPARFRQLRTNHSISHPGCAKSGDLRTHFDDKKPQQNRSPTRARPQVGRPIPLTNWWTNLSHLIWALLLIEQYIHGTPKLEPSKAFTPGGPPRESRFEGRPATQLRRWAG